MSARSLVRVTSLDRKSKHLLMVDGVQQTIGDGVRKLQLDCTLDYKLFVDCGEDAGLPVEEDDVLLGLATVSRIVVCIVPADQEWTQLSVAPPEPPALEVPAPPCQEVDPEQDSDGCGPATLHFTVAGQSHKIRMKKLWDILNPALEEIKATPPPPDAPSIKNAAPRKAAQEVTEQVWNNFKTGFSLDTCRHYASALISYENNKYSAVFQQNVLGTACSSGIQYFASRVYGMLNYQKSLLGDKTRKRRKKNDENSDPVGKKIRVRRVRGAYCCPNYSPDMPPQETQESQEQKRLDLLTAAEEKDYGHITVALIVQSFATQRNEINDARSMSILCSSFMNRWPIFGVGQCFLVHCSELTRPKEYVGVWDCQAIFDKQLSSRMEDIMAFMKAFWTREKRQKKPSVRTRKAAAMLEIIAQVEEEDVEMRSRHSTSIAVFQLVCAFLKEDSGYMVVCVPEHSSEETIVEAVSIANENPIMVVKGPALHSPDAVCEVRVLDTVVIATADVVEGFLVWFMAFHMFDFCYTREVQSTLEFIQRFFLGLHEEGDRRENPRRNVAEVDTRVEELANSIKNATSPWALNN